MVNTKYLVSGKLWSERCWVCSAGWCARRVSYVANSCNYYVSEHGIYQLSECGRF